MRLGLVFSFFLLMGSAVGQEAQVDVSGYTFKREVYSLSSKWEFYWGTLLEPKDFKTKLNRQAILINVPSAWSDEVKHASLGVATYRTKIKTGGISGLALYFPIINSAAKVWVDGNLTIETGKVSSDRNLYKPSLSSTLIELPTANEIEIVIQVSNYTDLQGGLVKFPHLGKVSVIMAQLSRRHGIENFFAGSLIAMFIYLSLLSFLHQNGKPFLWLSLICLGVALRSLILHGGSFLLPNLFPQVPWEIWKKIEFGSVYIISAFFPLYVYHLFKSTSPRWPIILFVSVATLLCICVVLTPEYVYSRILDVGHISLLMGFIYAIFSVTKAWRNGAPEARIIFMGVVASFPFILVEILKNSMLYSIQIDFKYLVELGVLVFLLFQVYLLSNQFAKAYKILEAMNQNLEQIITERTGELVTANRVKDQLLSVVSHDIKSPINSLQGLLKIYNNGGISQEEFKNYSKHIEGDLGKTGLLIDNILYWTASQLKGLEIKSERFDANNLMQQNVDLFSTIAASKGIMLKTSNENCLVNFDRNILDLTLRNLLANAIKFSNEKSDIIIQSVKQGDTILIQVIDFGLGMSQELINALQNHDLYTTSLGTNNEKGTGMGLSFSMDFLKKAGGNLLIDSKIGEGSTFTIVIPA